METLIAYVAQDRRFQLAGKVSLRERTSGAALFADISGFTALTEALANSLGPRRGAEELSIHLNAVYESLIAEAERFGGSVVAFAGDAITCWFGGDDGSRAITAALSMQAAMDRFAEVRLPNGETRPLAVKTGVAHGTARRFIVGNPEIQTLDVMAGSTLDRMADAAAAAHPRETLVAEETARAMGARLELREWRTGNKAGARVAAVQSFTTLATPVPWPENPPLTESTLQPFLLRPVWDRLKAGQGEFLTELRPAVALFLHFEGIDYDRDDDAAERLDAYVRWVQSVVDGYGGFLLALGMGDKGSHLYCCFGAPVAFENNAWRAAAAAEELRSPPPFLGHFTSIRIGISSGTVRTGAYGSSNRRTYGVLADTVNLAARLMERAAPEQILVSGDLHHAIRTDFRWRARSGPDRHSIGGTSLRAAHGRPRRRTALSRREDASGARRARTGRVHFRGSGNGQVAPAGGSRACGPPTRF
jgi:class 3 adenylate cyclase